MLIITFWLALELHCSHPELLLGRKTKPVCFRVVGTRVSCMEKLDAESQNLH